MIVGRPWRVSVGREGSQEQQTCSLRASLAARTSFLTLIPHAPTGTSNRAHVCRRIAHKHRHMSAMATKAAMDCRPSVPTSASPGSSSDHAPRRQERARAQASSRTLGSSGKEIH